MYYPNYSNSGFQSYFPVAYLIIDYKNNGKIIKLKKIYLILSKSIHIFLIKK